MLQHCSVYTSQSLPVLSNEPFPIKSMDNAFPHDLMEPLFGAGDQGLFCDPSLLTYSFGDASSSLESPDLSPMTVSGDEFHSSCPTPTSSPPNTPPTLPKDDIADLGRTLRTNLAFAQQRMMQGLKQSRQPQEQAMYTRLERAQSISSTSHSQHRIHKPSKKVAANTSIIELQANENGFVSVVIRKKSTVSKNGSAKLRILARSLSFKVLNEQEESDDDTSERDDLLQENAKAGDVPATSFQADQNDSSSLLVSPAGAWFPEVSLPMTDTNFGSAVFNNISEQEMIALLQRAGYGVEPPPLIANDELDLTELLDFDRIASA
ncbi:hypothetical protein DM01DRAFT_1403937 [Hesseltinella vesiculosa]|uniref:Uncharacterized protein n=1 Tax=Hesseltinella vesiculosa TaxID=101127 RepID=A0A1X2GW38_9FUNG|nr:hypothetical protein DM01DRAFT_1403937 [Hesseltinella vesiculosa]